MLKMTMYTLDILIYLHMQVYMYNFNTCFDWVVFVMDKV